MDSSWIVGKDVVDTCEISFKLDDKCSVLEHIYEAFLDH